MSNVDIICANLILKEDFRMNMRPFVVEFTGTPEAGKTTTIKQVIPLLEASQHIRQDGVHYMKRGEVRYVREAAEVTPSCIPKTCFDATFWMRAHTVADLFEQLYNASHNDIIIADRGIIDAQFFGYKSYAQGLCSKEEYESFTSLIKNKTLLPDLLIYLKTLPEESIRRRGGEGRLVTLDWIRNYNDLFEKFLISGAISVPLFSMDTTGITQDFVVQTITNKIISDYVFFINQR